VVHDAARRTPTPEAVATTMIENFIAYYPRHLVCPLDS
jgi:hypothetical protein